MGHGRWHRALWNREATVCFVKRGSRRDWIVMGALALLGAAQAAFLGHRMLGYDSDGSEVKWATIFRRSRSSGLTDLR